MAAVTEHPVLAEQTSASPLVRVGQIGGPTMSSREIADLVESRHDSVKRAIERLADREVIGVPPLVEYLDSLGRKATEYHLCKRDSYIVVAQLSPEFTARLVDRWDELERQVRNPAVPSTLSRMDLIKIALAAETEALAERAQRERLEAEVVATAPKAAALDLISARDGSLTITQAAKLLGQKRKDLIRWMADHGWIYRSNGSWVAHSSQVASGRLEYKEATWTSVSTGQDRNKFYCHVTPKGLTKLAEVFGRGVLQ